MFATNLSSVLDRMLTLSQAMDEGTTANREFAEGRPRMQLWLPTVDLFETDDAFVIAADLPGVHLENVDIQFDRGTLTISGTRGATLPALEKGQLRVFSAERATGNFARSVRLPEHVDPEKIGATLTDGVLTVEIPKAASALPRKIPVRSNVSDRSQLSA
jgi:HSP20 family protein